jgi:glycerol-3-phosphate dehydrogenase
LGIGANGEACFDVLVIGGGINGCGVARDASGRGFSVLLAEMADLGSGTSSWSTKLIHGGLRYLEHYEFRLVREALRERERLWASAPHVVRPLRLVLPHQAGQRPTWLLRLGLFLYDHIGGRCRLPKTRTLDLSRDPLGRALRPGFSTAFEFSDCWADDARLVVLNARDASGRGASIRTRTRVTAARRVGNLWSVTLEDRRGGESELVHARCLVNAAGPWVDRVIAGALGAEPGARRSVRLVQGSHIVVPRRYDDPRAFFFQAADGRVIFAIPYESAFTLIGTTDSDFTGDPKAAKATEAEIAYLCAAASDYLVEPVQPQDVVWAFSGVRPLYDDGASRAQEATRDYVLRTEGSPTLINIFGGKLTTYRRLAEAVLERVEGALGRRGPPWTEAAHLPGGDFPMEGLGDLVSGLEARHAWLPPGEARRLGRLYGTEAERILGDAAGPGDLGRQFGAGLTEAEVRHHVEREWAETSDDILWRRTKLGLRVTPDEAARLDAFVRGLVANRHAVAAE